MSLALTILAVIIMLALQAYLSSRSFGLLGAVVPVVFAVMFFGFGKTLFPSLNVLWTILLLIVMIGMWIFGRGKHQGHMEV